MNRYESLYFDVNSAIQGMCSSNYPNLSPPKGNFSSDVLTYISNVLMEDDFEDKASPPIHDPTLTAVQQSLCDVLYDRQPFFQYNNTFNSNIMVSDFNSSQSSHVCPGFHYDMPPPEFHYDMPPPEFHYDMPPPEFHYGMPSNSESSFSLMEGNFMVSGDNDRLINHSEAVEVNSYYNRGKRVLSPESLVRVRKTHEREQEDEMEEMRSNKQLSASASSSQEELILHDMFDKMLVLWGEENACSPVHETVKTIYNRKGSSKREAVDTRSLLIQCVQAIGCNDQNSAIKLLKKIRHRSSLVGDGTQRLAHYFANALEARLANSGFPGYKNVVEKDKTFSDTAVIKALELYLSKFPTVVTSYLFASDMITGLTDKSTAIHILHFGIVHGLQWLPFIQRLSGRAGGPPKLRVTGIDIPQSGFRPAARVEETGRRLAGYCERFGVPFEYNAIAAKWETLSVSDFKIKEDETVIVNCLYQFMYLQDDTISKDSPRDAVLRLIRSINPDLFIHGVLNGAFSSPFFVSRFRDALFHFSAFFDMYDAVVERDNEERLILERELLGKEILNVVACEGLERIVRPETSKQWQTRTLRAGFKQVPVGKETVEKLKSMVMSNYHKDFLIEVSNQSVLQGWKGRVLFAISCWRPA